MVMAEADEDAGLPDLADHRQAVGERRSVALPFLLAGGDEARRQAEWERAELLEQLESERRVRHLATNAVKAQAEELEALRKEGLAKLLAASDAPGMRRGHTSHSQLQGP